MKPLLLDEVKHAVRAELKTPLGKGLVKRVCTDSRQIEPEDLFVALRGDRYDGHDYINTAIAAGARAVMIDRNIPVPENAESNNTCVMKVDDTLEALGLLARFYRRSLRHSVQVIAITGSNGKTTTREMIYHTLSKFKKGYRSPHNYNNQIGVPLTLLGIDSDHDFAVVEIGANAPGEVAQLSRICEPNIAVITHIGPTHLEGFKDLDGVSTEKVSIVVGLQEHGIVVCCVDHPRTLERLKTLGRHVITFGLDNNADVSGGNVHRTHGQVRFETNDRAEVLLPIAGTHNVKNALAALAVVRRLGISSTQFAQAMQDFVGAKRRMACHHVNGITIIDDCYNASPSSMTAALAELNCIEEAARRIMVVGDMYELGDASEHYHRQLGADIAGSKVDLLLTVGSQAAWTAEAALQAGMGRSSIQRAISSKRLARLIKSMIRDEDTILVKGSRAMKMELVVEALQRYRGGRPVITAPAKGYQKNNIKKKKTPQTVT
ncbi:MAG: UDP-N-acetylmuramoyl-tripeptide--D-alanyl-D-alanine ligase [Planctomycetes bacterium]|nr:UDP-N-acetylmuramoyl-tripeptide--D-alanyl-D-alanine ligase [Planctomycetota bacterium]